MIKYKEYKDYDPIIGLIPCDWKLIRSKYILREREARSVDGSEDLLSVSQYTGVTRRKDGKKDSDFVLTRALSLTGYKTVEFDNLVVNIMLAWNGSLGVSKYAGITSPAYGVYEISGKAVPKFIDYLIRTDLYKALFKLKSTGVIDSRLRLYTDQLYTIPFILPTIDEQIQIARYLDYKNYQINKYIRIKKRQIELLKELKQTIINDAVTGKIDVRTGKPYADYSKTTNSVIPEYPSHWNDSKLRQLLLRFSMKNSPSLPLLSVVREKGVIVRDVKNFVENRNYIPEDLSGYKVVREKFFVINKMKAWQGSYGVSDYEGIVSPAYYVFKLKSVSGRFFNHAIRAKAYVPFFGMASDGIRTGQWDLSFERMKDIPFYKPPIDEQLRICEYHEDWCDKIDRTIEQLKGSLEPIHELQTRLISDVVTGKLDVREIEVPDLPEDELEQEFEVEEEPVEEIENGD